MPQIGLTATNLSTDSNAAARTVPSPQPPSVLPSVYGGYQLPGRTGTMAPNEEPDRVPMDAGVSSAPGERDANVAEVPNGARWDGFPAVRPEVPECFPEGSPSFFPKQEWAGRVTAIDNGTFDARLRNMTDGGREVATIDLEEVGPEDRAQMRVGSLFHWVMGYERSASGTRSNVSRIVFLDAPRLTKRDLERGRRWAEWLHGRWGSE